MSHLVLVTGGAGFIGSHLVDALLARGDRVRVLDDFSTGRRENLARHLADIELLVGDVRDPDLVSRAVAGCDGVLHEAAIASVTQSLADPVRCDSVTHGGTVNVVRLARRAGVGGFVLASSCAIYGDARALPIREDAPPRPVSPYALAKLLAEGVCRVHARVAVDGPPAAAGSGSASNPGPPPATSTADTGRVALRYFNVYGPRQDAFSEYSGVIARFLSVAGARDAADARGAHDVAGAGEARTGQPASPRYTVYGDGRQSRDFVYVSDVVAANLLALDAALRGQADGEVLNVGAGAQTDLLTLAAEIERLRGGDGDGRPPSCREGEAPIDFREARDGDVRASQADIARAGQVLGYAPATSFAAGLAATYAWYVEHKTRGVS